MPQRALWPPETIPYRLFLPVILYEIFMCCLRIPEARAVP
jgi:hypothetical protein